MVLYRSDQVCFHVWPSLTMGSWLTYSFPNSVTFHALFQSRTSALHLYTLNGCDTFHLFIYSISLSFSTGTYKLWTSFIPFPSTTSLLGGKTRVIGLLKCFFSCAASCPAERNRYPKSWSKAELEKQTRNYLNSHAGYTPVTWPIAQWLPDTFHTLGVEGTDKWCVIWVVHPVSWSVLRWFFFASVELFFRYFLVPL